SQLMMARSGSLTGTLPMMSPISSPSGPSTGSASGPKPLSGAAYTSTLAVPTGADSISVITAARPRRSTLAVGLTAATVLVGAGSWLISRSTVKEASGNNTNAVAATSPVEATPAAAASAPAPASVEIRLEVTPSTARIYWDDALVAKNPSLQSL